MQTFSKIDYYPSHKLCICVILMVKKLIGKEVRHSRLFVPDMLDPLVFNIERNSKKTFDLYLKNLSF